MKPATPENNYIFAYRVKGKTSLSGLGKTGTLFSIISIVTVSVLFIAFLIQAIYFDPRFFIFAAIFAVLVLLFGPYQFRIKKYYCISLDTAGTLEMKSVINFIPKSYLIDIKNISYIEQQNISISPAVLFYNSERKLIAKFNPMMIPQKTFLSYLREINSLNPNIKFGFKI